MQLIFWNGPNNGRWSGTVKGRDGHVQLNGVPGSKTADIEELIRVFGDEQGELPPSQAVTIAMIEDLEQFTRRKDTGNTLPIFDYVEVAEDAVTGETLEEGDENDATTQAAAAKAAKEAADAKEAAAQAAADKKAKAAAAKAANNIK